MLTKIRWIKGCGVFGDFSAPADLPDLTRYTIVYGENGTGKTTLARLFGALEKGEHPEYPELDYRIESQAGPLVRGQPYGRKVRVFNSDYVEANIGQFQGPLRHILIVGEENKALAEEAAAEKAMADERNRAITAAETARAKLETDRGKIFSAIAKTIGEATSGSTLRSYRKPDAEKAFAAAQQLSSLDTETLETHRGTVRQNQLDAISIPTLPHQNAGAEGQAQPFVSVAGELPSLVAGLLARTAQAAALRRLVDAPDIARWVEEGLVIHRTHRSEHCEFCAQRLTDSRLAELGEHFGVEDQDLKSDIEAAIETVRRLGESLGALSLPPKTELYAEMQRRYDEARQAVEGCRADLASRLRTASELLEHKLLHRATSLSESVEIDMKPLQAAMAELAAIVEQHNRKTEDFDRAKADARAHIEHHYLSTIAEQVREFDEQIAGQQAIITRLTNGGVDLPDPRSLAALTESYEEKQAKVSSAHAGGAALTERLKAFLGRTDLRFESGPDGYHVRRRGKPAKRLSEGEKTAIAFLYFIVQLGDREFNIAEGVVVIDDPISSMDAASIYQAFAFLKNAVKDAKQIILLTHNFDFLKLLLNWFGNFRRADRCYLMIVCAETETSREACLKPLDALLLNHPTEYNFLFKLLYDFRSDGTILGCYHIPNVARKVLETFLQFHRPAEQSIYAKLEATNFDLHKKTAIFKFANDLSHATGKGFDPALVAETQKNVTYLLEMIKEVAPLHFEGLEKLAQA
jgi:wobble nucleotide-excising tRNase